ncbi:MAG TPA: sulfotransferase [Thermoanaerobaculia bacterium]|nr:sulfotransferase [Thermoanaerobaculia bacterium]
MICVAGMPRSGTSLVTQMLHRCGVDLGPREQLMPASINNTDGFWENLRFVQLNERLLKASGGTWFVPPATLRPTPNIIADAKAIAGQFEGREPWAWKDPRNAVTLPFWKTLLPSMKVLVCVRHPAETAASLLASTLIPRTFHWWLLPSKRRVRIYDAALELWRVSNTTILEHTTPADRIVTHYDAVLANPRVELERIVAFAGVSVSSEVLDEAVRVVSPRLRHQRADAATLNPEIAALYAQLLREASNISA